MAVRANKYHAEARSASQSMIVAIWYSGTALNEARALVKHGHWDKWLAKNFDGDQSTAWRYMHVARNRARVQDLDPNLSLRATLNSIRVEQHEDEALTLDIPQRDHDVEPPSVVERDDEIALVNPVQLSWEPAGVMLLGDWLRVIINARLFVSDNECQPTFTTVRLEAIDGNIISAATDGLVLGVSRADYHGRPFTATIGYEDVDRLIDVAKNIHRGPRDSSEVQLGIGETFGCRFRNGQTQTVTLSGFTFPNYRKLLSDAAALPTEGTVSYDPSLLARFDKVSAQHGVGMKMWVRSRKATVVQIGENFVGLIMPNNPRRDATTEWRQPAWLAPITESTNSD